MKAVCWHGTHDLRVDNVDDPKIQDPRDIVVRITATAICGSDLHLYDGMMPAMQEGDVIGHEPMGIVEEVGAAITKFRKGDRVVVPFTLSCGHCFFCNRRLFSLCDESNPNAEMAAKQMGHSPAGLLGYSHLLGGFPGGQAEYLRVPYADVGPIKVPEGLSDEQVLFLSDIFPTGYMAAENAQIEDGDTVAIWGCGPVGQFAIQSAWMFGAGRVIAIDRVPERLRMAERVGKAETVHFDHVDPVEFLTEINHGRGPDRCIDAVGAESHGGGGLRQWTDQVKTAVGLAADRPEPLREAILACRKGGTVSVPGVYIDGVSNIPFGAAMNKGLTFKMGQTHVPRYLDKLLAKIESGRIDPGAIITHRGSLDDAPQLYKKFRDKEDGCVKVVLKP